MKNILLLALAVSTFASAQVTKPVSYKDGAQQLNGLAVMPEKRLKDGPGILILPAWMGIDDHAKEVANNLAKMGYCTFIADIYGEGNYPKNTDEAGKKSAYFKTNYVEYQKRIVAALEQLIAKGANKDRIVVIGYCFGGTGALEAARMGLNVKGVVSFHGGLSRDASRKIDPIKTKVLVCHGADDKFIPDTDIKAFQDEMRTAKADWQMVYYADAVHAFTDKSAGNDKSKGVAYNEKADKRSWQHFMDLLKEIFG